MLLQSATSSDAATAAVYPAYDSVCAALVSLESRLSKASPDATVLYAGCSPDAKTALAAVFGVEFGALRTAGFSIADVSPKFAAWLEAAAWSQPWFPVPAATPPSAPVEAAAATAEGSSGKKKSGKDTKAAPSAAAPSATEAETAGVPPTKPAKAGKPAKGGDSGGKNAGAAYAASLLTAVSTEPLAPTPGTPFSSEALRLPLLQVGGCPIL